METMMTVEVGAKNVTEFMVNDLDVKKASVFPFTVTVVSALIMALAAVVGTFSNILVILAVCVSKDLQNARSAFIVNMAIADLQVTAIADPFSAIAKVKGQDWFDARPGLCDALGTFCTMICVTSLLSLAGVSMNRYIHICHFRYYDRVFTLRNSLLMCLSFWLIGGLLVTPNHFGWGSLNFDTKSLGCMFDRTADYSYTAFFMLFLVGAPLVLIAHSFIRIYQKVHKTRIQLAGHGTKASRVDSVKLAKTLFVVFISFTICWFPFMATQVIDRYNTGPAWLYLWVTIQAHLHSSFNGLLYCITNLKFRRAYAKVLRLDQLFKRSARVAPESTRNTYIFSLNSPTTNCQSYSMRRPRMQTERFNSFDYPAS